MPSQTVQEQPGQGTRRIDYVDFLKVIGLAGIVAAHTGPPGWVIMLRCFDVPLMVILSAALGERSYGRRADAKKPVSEYYFSRIKRLVFPTWIFLILFFLFQFLTERTVYSFRFYLDSFLLTHYGIDYVWIILNYLYSALMIPFFFRYGRKRWVWVCIGAAYLLYELAYQLRIGTECRFIMNTFYDFVPYGAVLTLLGCSSNRMSSEKHAWTAAAALFVFAGIAVYYRMSRGMFLSVQGAKYPARLYYISYGVGCSFALLAFCGKFHFRFYRHPWIQFISAHSLWIYLWHILVLDVYRLLHLPENWMIKWLTVFTASVLTVYCINAGLDAAEKRKQWSWLKYFRG